MATVSPDELREPLTIALDIGTSSVRAMLFDGLGRAVPGIESRITYRMDTEDGGGVQGDADGLVMSSFEAIDGVVAQAHEQLLRKHNISAVAVSTFWHALIGVGASGKAVTPLFSWNDTRSARHANELRRVADQQAVHSRTGCVLHASYWPAKLAWLRDTRSELFDQVACWMSIGEYLYQRLFGKPICSVSIASATGLLNQQNCDWDPQMLLLVGVTQDRLPEIVDFGNALTDLIPEFAKRWPSLTRARWFPPIGDGACGNIGSGCVTRNRAAINIGTSGALRVLWENSAKKIPPGLWCYRADRRRVVMGGALSNGGDLFAWMTGALHMGDTGEFEAELAAMEPDGHGLTVLPFLSGERSTGWHDEARGVIAGLTLDSAPLEILRAGLEAVAYRLAAIYDLIAREIGEPDEIIASGAGALASTEWTQIICDVLGRPVQVSAESEASSRGAVLMALEALGAIESIERVETAVTRVHSPRHEYRSKYASARARHEALYRKLLG